MNYLTVYPIDDLQIADDTDYWLEIYVTYDWIPAIQTPIGKTHMPLAIAYVQWVFGPDYECRLRPTDDIDAVIPLPYREPVALEPAAAA